MSKRNKYSAGMLGAALIVGIGIGFCGGFVTGICGRNCGGIQAGGQ